jgi:hypothetical protein
MRAKVTPPPMEYCVRLNVDTFLVRKMPGASNSMSELPRMICVVPLNQRLSIVGGGTCKKYSKVNERRFPG